MRKQKQKKILISVISLVLAAALGLGLWYGITHSQKDPIPVIAFSDVGMTEYWGDNMESHGPVSSDNIQTVFLSDTQTVTEILVKEGDMVKKGDPMMTFDTTLSGLDLERKRLEVEKLKLELLDAEDELKTIKGMKPMQTPPELPEPGAPNLGFELTRPYRISGKPGLDGSAADKPLICWIRDDRDVDQSLVDEILQFAMDIRVNGAQGHRSSPSGEDTTAETGNTDPVTPPEEVPQQTDAPTVPQQTESAETKPAETKPAVPSIRQPASRDNEVFAIVTAKKLTFRAEPSANAAEVKTVACNQATVRVYEQVKENDTSWAFTVLGNGAEGVEGWVLSSSLQFPGTQPDPKPTVPEETKPHTPGMVVVDFLVEPREAEVTLWGMSTGASVQKIGRNRFQVTPNGIYQYSISHDGYEKITDRRLEVHDRDIEIHKDMKVDPNQSGLSSVYVVFKSTEGNMSRGERTVWQGMKLFKNGLFKLFDASNIPDYTMAAELEDEEDPMPDFDFGSGMTAGQIAELRKEQEKKIEELRLSVKMAEADYKIKKRELEDGNIYADFDGKVVSLLSEEESRKTRKPMIKVSGGGGYQIEGSVNELSRETMKIGQKVTVNDWNSGGSYEGEIIAIGEFPVRMRGYNGRGNPNSSYYPFTVFVGGDADLQTGSYVSIQYASSETENGVYLNNPFIREEKGQSFVYVLGENDRLEKRNVTTGKALWGSYTEITSGLSAEDYLAFPYGKNVKPGAKAKIGDMSDFYN